MEYIVMAYLLGIGFIIGLYTEARFEKDKDTKTEHINPAEILLFVIFSPVIAAIWGLVIFFKWKED